MSLKEFPNFNIEHVDRIVAATRLDVSPDRNALLADLLDCYRRYKKQISSGRFKRQRERHISLQKHIKSMLKLLHDDDVDGGVINKMSGGDAFRFALACDNLYRLLEYGTQASPAEFARVNKERWGLTRSALQELVGASLPPVYEKHFKRDAGLSHSPDGGPPYGPFIRFALQTTKEMGIECSADTVEKAFEEAKKQKRTHFDYPLAGNLNADHLKNER
jgi:hypothetical protein